MDLSFLGTLYENQSDGPSGYVSVYLDTTPTSASAAEELSLRWRAARERLADAGADDATLAAVEDVLSSRTHDARGQAVFAAAGTVLLDCALPLPPRQEIASYAPLPHVMPLLEQLPLRVPHVLVAADRAGGQVLTVPSDGPTAEGKVQGESWPVHKVSTGGWSEQRLQRSAERDLGRRDQVSGATFAGGTEVWVGPGLADAALARAAAGTGAKLFFITPDADSPRDGVGALLRAPLSAV